MRIKAKVDQWDVSPLTNFLNKIIDYPEVKPKGNPFKLTFRTLPEDEYPEFRAGRRVTQAEAEPY